jgi:hypothetical protein
MRLRRYCVIPSGSSTLVVSIALISFTESVFMVRG